MGRLRLLIIKKLLGILVLGFLLSNIAYSEENVTLVCSFEKSVIEIPNASSGDGEIVKNKDELSPSVTMDKYIVLNILSKDEAIVVDTSFHHDLNGKFEFKNTKASLNDTEISFSIRIHEDWINIYILDRYTGKLQKIFQRFEENGIWYYSCNKKDKII